MPAGITDPTYTLGGVNQGAWGGSLVLSNLVKDGLTLLGSLACGEFIARYGAIRVSQVCVLVCAAGIAAVALLPASVAPLLAAAAFAMGIGYGPITAASSEILVRTTPVERMALTFSIKQTGVPGGIALAGAVMPGLALLAGWRVAFVAVAIVGVAVALGAEPTRKSLDRARAAGMDVSAAIDAVLRERGLA